MEPGHKARAAATWHLSTPHERTGAIAIVSLRGDVEGAMARLGIAPVGVGEMRLRGLAGIDRGVVARVKHDLALLMPHGGPEILRQLAAVFRCAGLVHETDAGADARFPEARSPFEAHLLDALARAASPRAIGLLLDQPRRWADRGEPTPDLMTPAPDENQSRRLDRLVSPPLVVAVGASNIGKSTLLNRLCGRAVAATADEPGTTRDHVGSLVEVDGLVVRYVDTPGVREDAPAPEREAGAIAERVLAGADLVLWLGDKGARPEVRGLSRAGKPAPLLSSPAPLNEGCGAVPGLRVALRADLGEPTWEHDAAVSAMTGLGMAGLAVLIRRALVSDEALASPLPWRFWSEAGPGALAWGSPA